MTAPTSLATSAPPAIRLAGSAVVAGPAAVRMDVAAFVGRVERGLVAAVESIEEFAAAFGEAPDSGLGPAVRAFFRNGGRRCWVIPAEPPFFDERLASFGVATLQREASLMDHPAVPLCSWPANPAPTGVHAVLALEEVTLLAVPDAFPPRPVRDTLRRGTVKAVNAAAGTVTLTTDGKDEAFLLTENTQVTGADGKPVAKPFENPGLNPGSAVTFRSAMKDGNAVLVELWLGTQPPSGGTTGTGTTASEIAFARCKVPDAGLLSLNFTLTTRKKAEDTKSVPPREWLEASWDWSRKSQEPGASAEEAAARAGARFELERSADATFSPNQTETVYRGPAMTVVIAKDQATYRVRAQTAALVGAWSAPLKFAVPMALPVPGKEDPVATQVAAVKVCAARGDVFAVLVPPEGWPTITPDEWKQLWAKEHPATSVGDWVQVLKQSKLWLGSEDTRALRTHAAVWGPWVLARDSAPPDSEPEAFPADGAICGLLARRTIERGAWGSILSVPIDGALGLGPPPYGPGEFVPLFVAEPPSRSRAAVEQQQVLGVNVLARGARGFGPVGERTAWPDPASGTLGDTPELVPLRRFMALLRRELFRVGADLAFLPNGPALERRATRAVESLLEGLLRRGALIGPDARSSFQVTARAGEPGPAESQLVVEVRVRAAYPLRVLTLRLVRTGEGAFAITEGQA